MIPIYMHIYIYYIHMEYNNSKNGWYTKPSTLFLEYSLDTESGGELHLASIVRHTILPRLLST